MAVGLVLTGGGARAAYQVGALRALAEILNRETTPFSVIAGVSAGAINGSALAAGADDFSRAVKRLLDTWGNLAPEKVYRTDSRSFVNIGSRWIKDLSSGGVLGRSEATHLLDTQPLRELLSSVIPMSQITRHVESGCLRGFALSATSYATGSAITFFDAHKSVIEWGRSTRIGLRQPLTIEHIMASSAIPIFFPPIRLGEAFFGDGCVRLTTPVSPAIHMGAEKILAIGMRFFRSVDQTWHMNELARQSSLSISDITGVMMNALFLDSLDSDLERVERINRTLSLIPEDQIQKMSTPLRPIPVLALRPSIDLGSLAAHEFDKFPSVLKFLLKGIGAEGESGWDLLSYLAFNPGYLRELLDLGYQDTLLRRDEVAEFFYGTASP